MRALYWDSDAAGALVVAHFAGHGDAQIPRFGWWSTLWWLLATRGLPGHEHIWEVTGYVFALATAGLVGWATSRVAGRWAGVTAGAVALVVGPKTLSSLLTVNFHTTTPFTAAVLAAYLVVLTRRRSYVLASLVGVFAGVNAASDPLLWIAGITPFVLAAAILALASGQQAPAVRAAVVLCVAAPCAVATGRIMSALGFHLIPVGLNAAHLSQLGSNFAALGKSIALVFGANFLSQPTYPGDPLRYLVALLGIAGVAAVGVAAVRAAVRRSTPTLQAYATFWAVAAVLVGLAYWGTDLGAGGGPGGGLNYMLVYAPAAGVGVGLLAASSERGRIAAGLAIAVVGATNVSGVAEGFGEDLTSQAYRRDLLQLLEREGLVRGYAPYWDSQSLTWKSGTRLLIAPVRRCEDERSLCRMPFFTVDSWYDERPGRSFLIVDPASGLWGKPPANLGPPSRVERLPSEPDVVVYVYPYDLAQHIRR